MKSNPTGLGWECDVWTMILSRARALYPIRILVIRGSCENVTLKRPPSKRKFSRRGWNRLFFFSFAFVLACVPEREEESSEEDFYAREEGFASVKKKKRNQQNRRINLFEDKKERKRRGVGGGRKGVRRRRRKWCSVKNHLVRLIVYS